MTGHFIRALNHEVLEDLRIEAVWDVGAGGRPEDVVRVPGLILTVVHDRLAQYREGDMDALQAGPAPGRSPATHSGQSHRMYGTSVTEYRLWHRFRFGPRPRGAVRAQSHSVLFHGACARRIGVRLGQRWHAVYQHYTDNGAVLPVEAGIVGL